MKYSVEQQYIEIVELQLENMKHFYVTVLEILKTHQLEVKENV